MDRLRIRNRFFNSLNAFFAVLLVTGLFVGCGNSGGEGNRGNFAARGGGGGFNRPERPQFKIPVTVTEVNRQRMYAFTQEVGTIVPLKQVEIKPEITGRIYYTQRWMEGDEVKAGDIFANMDDRELKINKRDMELNLEKAKAAVLPASAQLAQAIKDEEFSLRMFQRDAISKQEYDQAILARIQRENQYDESLKNIETAQMQVDKIEQEMEKIPVTIPFDGVLLPAEESLSAGQSGDSSAIDLTLQNGQTVSANAILCRLANIDQVYAALDVPAKDLLDIKIGQDVDLDVFSRVGTKFKGKVHDISTALNRGTRTYTVNVLVDNPDHELRPGMFVTANIITDEKPDAVIIPREIIQTRNNEEIVFVAKVKEKKEEPQRGGGFGGRRGEGSPDMSKKEGQSGQKEAFAAEGDAEDKDAVDDKESPDENEESGEEFGDEKFEAEKEPEVEMVVEKRVITRGIENRDEVEVASGLREGDLLVIIGYETLTDGVDVSVIHDTDDTMNVSSSN